VSATPLVAVAGCGHWGRNLVRNFAALRALACVVDADAARADVVAAEHGVPALGLAAALTDARIDAVAIAAPAAEHARLARLALEAGKHVFVEKPLALSIADAERLIALAERLDRRLMVGHLLQYHPAFVRLKELVREGALGRLRYVSSNRLNLGRIRREEDILWSFAPHDISMILSLVGSEPSSVTAAGGWYLHESIADVTTTHLVFPGGERAHVFVSWLHPFKEQKLVVVGEQAMAAFDDSQDWPSKLVLYRHRIDWRDSQPVPSRAAAEPVPLEPAEPLRTECAHFIDCVATGARPRTDGAEGLRVLKVLDAASRALRRPTNELPAAPQSTPEDVYVHPSAVVDSGAQLGAGSKIWHFSHVLADTQLGPRCVVGQNAMIGPGVTVGAGCKIQNNVSIYNGVTLEDDVFCGPSMVFTNVLTPRAFVERKSEFAPTLVRRGATIGANATVVCGVTIGRYAMVGAGAVVTRDVPDHALVVGNPARRSGWVSRTGEVLGEDLVCPRTGERYRETQAGLEIAEAALYR